MLGIDPSSARESELLTPQQIELVRLHLKEVARSHAFAGSKRAQDFLHLIVGHALEGEVDSLRERMIGAEMFGRPVNYDTGSDSVVRVKATEVRKKLAQFYLESNGKPAVRIELPIGSYVPRFVFEPSAAQAVSGNGAGSALSSGQTLVPFPEPASDSHAGPSHAGPSEDRPGAAVDAANRSATKKFRGAGSIGSRTLPRIAPRVLVGAVLALVLIALLSYVAWMQWYQDAHARKGIRSIAILPLKNLSGDSAQEFFADGMTEELINSLGQVSTLRVISLTSSMSYKGTKKKLPEIARELAVDGVVEGSVLREGNQVRISAQLIDAKTDRPIWAHEYVRDMTSVLALQGEVAQTVADEIRITMTPQEQARLARPRPIHPEAQDLYLHGIFLLNADDCNRAVTYFNQAIEKNPNYAQAHAALANCYGRMGESGRMAYKDAFPRQKAEATRAIQLDDSLPEGHAELANTAMTLDWDWTTAAAEFRRALELNPNSAAIHQKYAYYLVRTGQLLEANSEVERCEDLDPNSGRCFRSEGFIYYFSRRYDHALSHIKRVRALDINPPDWSFLLGDVYAEKGMYADSIAEFLKSGDGVDTLGHLGNVYGRAGHFSEARKTISQLEERIQKDGVGRYEIALVYIGMGRKQEAFKWLEDAYQARDVGMVYLKIDPSLDPLRADPRFDDLLRRVGLTK
jgi:TolB-like protein/tetratricopeptide (TPR) repeat protein